MAKHQYFSFVTVSQQQKAKSPEPRQNFKFVKIKEQKDLRLFKFQRTESERDSNQSEVESITVSIDSPEQKQGIIAKQEFFKRAKTIERTLEKEKSLFAHYAKVCKEKNLLVSPRAILGKNERVGGIRPQSTLGSIYLEALVEMLD